MKRALQRYLPFALGACLALAIATLLIHVRIELELAHETARIRGLLEGVSGEIGTELDRGARLLASSDTSSDSGWHSWHLGATVYQDASGAAPLIGAATLRRAVKWADTPDGSTLLIGPFSTAQNRNVIALVQAERSPEGTLQWRGASEFVDDLMSHSHAAALAKQGLELELYDSAADSALYRSDSGALDAPVAVPLRFGVAQLEMRAAPRDGWTVPARHLGSSVLVLLGVVLWLCHELRRGHVFRAAADDLAESEARRQSLNVLYGAAIENVAALESRLHVVSMYDTVTGLGNRSSLVRRIETALDAMRQSPQAASLSIMTVGFDHVHHISNTFGADFASRVLVIAAERVEFVLPAKDLLFRTGDFHLAVVLPAGGAARSAELAQKILTELESPIALDSHTFMLHPSIGIAETSSGYEYAESLLDRATAALAALPRDAPQRYCLFDSAAAKDSVSRLQLEVDLNRAFEEQQFVLEYEPFVAASTLAVAGFEALVRWDHPTEGRLAPSRFVPIAIQAGMSHRLNHWVMREAARQAAAWRRAGYRDLFVNFNLTAEAFLRPNLAEEIGAVLAEFELPGEWLVVELTESTLIQDVRGAARTLQRLGELGVRAWLDDFGTGYSSLSYLRALPLKGVKIDRSFVERTVIDARDFGFLKALIDLISYLGMQSIAEGVETKDQYELLNMTTCGLYQGYYFARSMRAAEAERWMAESGQAVKRGMTA